MSGGIIGKVSESNNTHLISNTFYAVSTTAGNTATKVAKLVDTSVNSITLIKGMLLIVRFTHANTANLPSLKIQSSSGTDLTNGIMIKGVSVDDTWVGTIPIGEWGDNGVVTLLYDGTYWVQTQGHDSDENVRQSPIGDNAAYDVLLAGTTGDSTAITEVYKNNNFNYNPSTNALSVGSITVGAAPTANMQVATKKYVDDSISSAGGGTVLGVTAGTGLQVGDGTGSQTISTTGTLNHSNIAHEMNLTDSEYDDARIWAFLFDNNGHIRKYKSIGIDPAEFGNVKVDGVYGADINRWAQCRTDANVAAKTANIQSGTLETLLIGTRVTVSFFYGSNADNPTLNINSTGAHDIYYNGYQLTELIVPAGATIDFAFDGTNWIVINYDYSSTIDDLWNAMPHVTSNYSSTGTDAVNGTAVNKALQTLDSSIAATTGQAISAITITDGKISGSTKIDIGAPKATWYGTCSTTASTAEKAVTCSNFDFTSGAIIGVLFSTANTAATPTLNVNSKGAKSIYVGASTPSSTTNVLKWSANTMVYFMYDGTYFRYITSVSAGSVIPSRGANTWYGTSSTGATTQAKTSTIDNFVLTKGAIVVINFSTANTYTSAKITLNINSTGAKDVYYKNAVTSSTNTLLWDANTALTFIYDGTGYQFVGRNKAANQNAFSNVKVGSTTIAADSKTDTLELVAGDNITLTPDATNDKITIAASGGGGGGGVTPSDIVVKGYDDTGETTLYTGNLGSGLAVIEPLVLDDASVPELAIQHQNSGVTAGTYVPSASAKDNALYLPSFTIDAQGHVTAASNYGYTMTTPTLSHATNSQTYNRTVGGLYYDEYGTIYYRTPFAVTPILNYGSGNDGKSPSSSGHGNPLGYSFFVLTAGQTSMTVKIYDSTYVLSNFGQGWNKFIVTDVVARDAVTKEPVILGWSATEGVDETDIYDDSFTKASTITITIEEAYANNIEFEILYHRIPAAVM